MGELRFRGSLGPGVPPGCIFSACKIIKNQSPMFILYIDGSGSVQNADEDYFILAGVAVFERQIYHMIRALDDLVEGFGLGSGDQIELHGSPMYSGRGSLWRSVPRPRRNQLIVDALGVLNNASTSTRAFGVAVNKVAVSPHDAVERAFEEICNRFNLFLQRRFHQRGGQDADRQRGLVVMDQSHYEQPLQALATEFRASGTRWGQLRNMAEVPLFVDSRASRLIQLADLIAFAMWRKYEHQDGRFFDPIVGKFDNHSRVIHGLVHYKPQDEECYCPACMSRQTSAQ